MTDTSMITLWHKRARPNPTEIDADVQIGCVKLGQNISKRRSYDWFEVRQISGFV